MLGLGREDGDVALVESGLGRRRRRRDRKLHRAIGVAQLEPAAGERRLVRTASDEDDVVAVLEEPPADCTADGAGAEDDVPHGPSFSDQ